MIDGEGDPSEELRSVLGAARELAAKGRNNVLACLIEAALEELDEQGLGIEAHHKLPAASSN